MTEGVAGPRGKDVRSDAWVRVEPSAAGGLHVDVRSKVQGLYGASIRRQIEDGCAALDLRDARVEVEDQGALPFVLAARLEAAVRAARDVGERALLPPMLPANAAPSPRERLRRTRLYLPGSQPKFMINAAVHRPDGVILDLEDSVAPSDKPAARVLVRNALRFLDWGDAERMVRINQLPAGLADLPFVVGHGAQVILVPKVDRAEDVVAVAEACARLAGKGPAPWIMPILESASGILEAVRIAKAHPTVCALTLGLEDLTADLGAERTLEGRESFFARSMVVAAARAAGIPPIDTVFSDVADVDGLAASVREAKALGFEGKGCIHPRQIQVVHDAFAPTDAEIEKASAIVRAFDDAAARGLAVVSLGTKMIDPPVAKRARRVLDLARRSGRLGGAANSSEPAQASEAKHG
ncbi:MAG: aldolase/citrate lyase family protein [bacterium]